MGGGIIHALSKMGGRVPPVAEPLPEPVYIRLPRMAGGTIKVQPVDLGTLTAALLSMKPSASTGDDEISIVMLQNYLTGFSDVLLDVVNSSLHTGQIPSSWKHAHVVTIPKVKAPKTPADTRPIPILPAISKLVEKLVQHQLVRDVQLPGNCTRHFRHFVYAKWNDGKCEKN